MTFSCTQKIQIKFKGIRDFSSEVEEIHINNWYVNWMTLFRKRFALITNSQTLFTVLMYCGTKSELKNFEQLFIQNLEKAIFEQTILLQNDFLKLDLNTENSKFTKTNSRSVLGHMNEFKAMTEYYNLNPENMEMEAKFLNHKMNDIPIKILKYKSPKQVMTETLLEQN